MAGTFIVFEGPEGGGKSIQTARLATWLRARGKVVLETREPGGTPIGDEIRTVLLSTREGGMLPETEVLLLAASRAQLVRSTIKPALDRGEDVICDRYVDSSFAYQGGGRQLPLASIMPIQVYATGGLVPDIRILLDLPVELGLKRRFSNPSSVNRIDNDGLVFHERVRATYLDLVRARPDEWIVIDASASIDEVTANIAAAIAHRIE